MYIYIYTHSIYIYILMIQYIFIYMTQKQPTKMGTELHLFPYFAFLKLWFWDNPIEMDKLRPSWTCINLHKRVYYTMILGTWSLGTYPSSAIAPFGPIGARPRRTQRPNWTNSDCHLVPMGGPGVIFMRMFFFTRHNLEITYPKEVVNAMWLMTSGN